MNNSDPISFLLLYFKQIIEKQKTNKIQLEWSNNINTSFNFNLHP